MKNISRKVLDFGREEPFFWNEEWSGATGSPWRLKSTPEARSRMENLRENVKRAFREFLNENRGPSNDRQLELIRPSYDAEEFGMVLDVLMDGRMTMGPITEAFESEWSAYLGVAGSVMVNSGSSANLLALSALTAPGMPSGLRPGDEVIVPAIAWSTTVFPIIQVGCIPVFVDVDPETLNIDPTALEEAIGPRTRAMVIVHLLGNPSDVERILPIAKRHDLWVIEDSCEAHGARIKDRHVGTFGDLSTFSFFFSHHMTTLEGGMVSFQDARTWRDRLFSLRSHGWVRERSDREMWKRENPDIDDRWLFVSLGFNLRPTEINAALGMAQLKKLGGFIERRREVRRRFLDSVGKMSPWLNLQMELPGHEHSAFAFSIIVDPKAPFSRNEFQRHLEEQRIQTRPIIGSNFVRQPVMRLFEHRVHGDLKHADRVHFNGLMIGNHHDVTPAQIDYVAQVIHDFLVRHPR